MRTFRSFRSIGLAVALVSLAAGQAFAIGGIGVHYTMNTGHLAASDGSIQAEGISIASIDQKKTSTLRGIGFKAWIDALPFVDLEATWNMQFASYRASLYTVAKDTIPLQVGFDGIPGYSAKANPVYANMNLDISAMFAIDFLPIPFITPYVGGGFTWMISAPVINAGFINDAIVYGEGPDYGELGLAEAIENGRVGDVAENLTDYLDDKGLNTGIGGHIIAGLRFKLPIIPIALYGNWKHYFGGGLESQFKNKQVFEIGGGFAL
jgi:hypothetical protein